MTKVSYDGETVEFAGGAPKDVEHFITLMHHNAATAGRVLLSVKVDGCEVLGSKMEQPWDACKQIEIKSGTQKDLFLKAIDVTLSQMSLPDEAIDPILESLLTDSWQNAFTKLNDFLQGLVPFFEMMANATQYAKNNPVVWKAELEKGLDDLEAAFTKILRLSEAQQVAELTGVLNVEFRPLYASLAELLKTKIRASFV